MHHQDTHKLHKNSIFSSIYSSVSSLHSTHGSSTHIVHSTHDSSTHIVHSTHDSSSYQLICLSGIFQGPSAASEASPACLSFWNVQPIDTTHSNTAMLPVQ